MSFSINKKANKHNKNTVSRKNFLWAYLISIWYHVSWLASFIFDPPFPKARGFCSSGMVTIALFPFSSMLSILAGFRLSAISLISSFSINSTKSIFSQSRRVRIVFILSALCQTKTPTGSIFSSFAATSSLLLFPGILTILTILTFSSSSSGTIFLKIASIKSCDDWVIVNVIPPSHFDISLNRTKISSPELYTLPGICPSGQRTTVVPSISRTILSPFTLSTFALRSSPCLC